MSLITGHISSDVFHRRGAQIAENDNILFAFACIPFQLGLSKANEKKSFLCALCASAVKFTR